MQLEAALVQAVQAATAGISPAVRVLTGADIADAKDVAQISPAVHVVYGGYQVAEAAGKQWRLVHRWYLVAAVRASAGARASAKSSQAARQSAGQLAALVAGALAGESLPGAAGVLELITPPAPQYHDGLHLLPVALQAQSIFKKP